MSKNCQILFRVDGSHSLGAGHLSRCLGLAAALREELASRGKLCVVHFLSVRDPLVREILESSPFEKQIHWIEQERDELDTFARTVKDFEPAAAVFDIDLRSGKDDYLAALRPGTLVVSLHEHNYSILAGDIVVAPTVRPLDAPSGSAVGVTHFHGPEYVLLGVGLTPSRAECCPISRRVTTCTVSMGGADPERITLKVIDVICRDRRAQAPAGRHDDSFLSSSGSASSSPRDVEFPPPKWHIVLGPASGYEEMFAEGEQPDGIVFHHGKMLSRQEFSRLIAGSDLVVTNAATTLYEALFLGRPCIAIPQNDFESEVADILSAKGACLKAETSSAESIAVCIERALRDFELRESIAVAGKQTIDGKGCERVARMIANRLERKSHN